MGKACANLMRSARHELDLRKAPCASAPDNPIIADHFDRARDTGIKDADPRSFAVLYGKKAQPSLAFLWRTEDFGMVEFPYLTVLYQLDKLSLGFFVPCVHDKAARHHIQPVDGVDIFRFKRAAEQLFKRTRGIFVRPFLIRFRAADTCLLIDDDDIFVDIPYAYPPAERGHFLAEIIPSAARWL